MGSYAAGRSCRIIEGKHATTASSFGAKKYGMEYLARVTFVSSPRFCCKGGSATRCVAVLNVSDSESSVWCFKGSIEVCVVLPLLIRWNISPIFKTNELGIGLAGRKRPGLPGSSSSRPPQSSWNSKVKELHSQISDDSTNDYARRDISRLCQRTYLQSVCAGIRATI